MKAPATALVLSAAALLIACGQDDPAVSGPAPETIDVVVRLDDDGPGGRSPSVRDLRCTAASDSAACRALRDAPADALAPVSRRRVCTEVFGGPQEAEVIGRIGGRDVTAEFSRSNGCEIARWERLAPLWDAVRDAG